MNAHPTRRPVIRRISFRYDVIAPDLCGGGGSDKPTWLSDAFAKRDHAALPGVGRCPQREGPGLAIKEFDRFFHRLDWAKHGHESA